MNLRVACLGLGLLSIAATGDPCSTTGPGGSSGGAVMSVGANDAVCASLSSEGLDGTPCCGHINDPCTGPYDCCSGVCSGVGGDGGGSLLDAGSRCAAPAVPTCTVALSSRCETGQCECRTSDDCCLGICAPTAIPGAGPSGTLRCCLAQGQPCGTNADCCSLTCDPETAQCD